MARIKTDTDRSNCATARRTVELCGFTDWSPLAFVANPDAKKYMTKEQAASQRDISDYGTKVNFWQWSPRREKYQEIWNEVKAAK